MARLKQSEIAEAISCHKTIYSKRIQSNGYYPAYVYEWDDNSGSYIGYTYPQCRKQSIYSESALLYVFTHNAFVCSLSPLEDSFERDDKDDDLDLETYEDLPF